MGTLNRLIGNKRGSVAVQIGVTAAVLFGFAGLGIDLGRTYTLHTELQQATDAAVLAAAAELDGLSGARARATAAATAFGTNNQTFGNGAAAVTITSIQFFSAIAPVTTIVPPAAGAGDTPAVSDPDAIYVQVQAQTTSVTGTLASFVTSNSIFSTTAFATAGRVPLACLDVPLFVCNPNETGTGGDPVALQTGQQIIVKTNSGGSPWGLPGNWGLLCPPTSFGSGNCGANNLGQYLGQASATGKQCVNGTFFTKPGNTVPAANGANTRFDMYSGSISNNDPNLPPSTNVTKGFTFGAGSNACNSTPTAPPNAMALPVDTCFTTNSCGTATDAKGNIIGATDANGNSIVGNGTWDRVAYWNVNHAPPPYTDTAAQMPSALQSGSAPDGQITRYQMYQWENSNNKIPTPSPTTTAETQEHGATATSPPGGAHCYAGTGTPDPSRRLFDVGVVDCKAANIIGKSTVRPIGYVEMFLTNPIDATSNSLYAEVTRVFNFNAPGPIANHVQLVR